MKDSNGRIGSVVNTFEEWVEVFFADELSNNHQILKSDSLKLVHTTDGVYDVTTLTGIAEPTAADLYLITRYMPLGYKPQPTDGVVVTFVSADNMVDRSLARWSPKSLYDLSRLPSGQPLILDHETEVDETQGLIFDSGIIKIENPPPYFTDCGSNKRYNRDIAKKEGYVGFVQKAFISNSNPIIDALKHGVGTVSLGYMFTDLICPLCNVSFFNDKCPHLIPLEETDRQDPNYAPWREKAYPSDIYELSLVVEPNLPRASILRNIHINPNG